MDAHLAEAFQKYDEYSAALATARDAAAKLESDVAYWRDQIVARAGGAKPRLIEPKPAKPPPAKPAPAPKAKPAPAPKAAPKPAQAAPWTPALAKRLLGEIAGGASVLRAIAKAGGSVPVSQVPRADGEGVMGVASVSPFLANVRSRARAAFIELPIASQSDGKVTLDPGLAAVLREMGGAS